MLRLRDASGMRHVNDCGRLSTPPQFMFATEQTDRFDESGACRDQSARGLGAELAQRRDAVGLAGSCKPPVLPEHCVFGLRVRRFDGLTGGLGPSTFPAKFKGE